MTTRSHTKTVHTIAPMGPRKLGQHKTYYNAVPHNRPCPACGQIIRRHERCAACRVLVGRGHSSDRLYDGLCEGCMVRQRDHSKQGALQVAVAIVENAR